MDGNYFDYHYLSDDVQREVEALFYDYPHIATHIGNLGKQLKEAEEDVIGSIGASFVSIVGSKTNKAHDSTSTARNLSGRKLIITEALKKAQSGYFLSWENILLMKKGSLSFIILSD